MNFFIIKWLFQFRVLFGDDLSEFDYSPLQGKTYKIEEGARALYFSLHEQPTIPCSPQIACSSYLITSNTTCACTGQLSNETVAVFSNSSQYGVRFTGKNIVGTVNYTTVVLLTCSESESIYGAISPNTTIDFKSPYGCRTSDPLYPQAAGNKKEKISWGWVFIIILVVSAFLYLVVGSLIFKFALHKEGIEIIPFVYFWVSIPRLTFEGIKFIILWIKSKVQSVSSTSGYTEVK